MTYPASRLLRQSGILGLLLSVVLGTLTQSAQASGCFVTRWIKSKIEKPVARSYTPSNVYRSMESLPADLRRVAVLPLTALGSGSDLQAGQQSLQPVLIQELTKAQRFEIVAVSAEKLRRWGGKTHWKAEEPFPAELLSKLREQYSCQAVIFAEVTQFQAYGPLQIGWRLKLIESRRGEIVWAADEVFDAGVPEVSTAATRFAKASQKQSDEELISEKLILSSPRRFAEYTLQALFHTLPHR